MFYGLQESQCFIVFPMTYVLEMQNFCYNIRKSSAINVLDCIRLHCLRKLQSYNKRLDNPSKKANVATIYLCKGSILRLVEDRPNIHVNAILHSCLQAIEQPWVISAKGHRIMKTGDTQITSLFTTRNLHHSSHHHSLSTHIIYIDFLKSILCCNKLRCANWLLYCHPF